MLSKDLGRVFIDTNVWLYAFIENEGDKNKSAVARALIMQSEPVVSTQVINEISVNLLRKAGFTEKQIRQLVEAFYEKYTVVEVTEDVLLIASHLRERYSLSFWDSMIVASALMSGVEVLYTEDMQHGLVVDKQLKIRNPFIGG